MSAPSPFENAWKSAAQAQLTRPDVRPMADPAWSHTDAHVAWWAAGVLAEVAAFQQVLGEWVEESLPSQQELKEALTGLRRGAKASGPLWWRKATRWWRNSNLELWRRTLEATKQAAWQRQAQTRYLVEAVGHARQGLDNCRQRVEQWQQQTPERAELATPWLMQASVQEATLMMLEQRTGLRWSQEKHLVNQINQASVLLEMVRTAKGADQLEQAWAKLSRELPSLEPFSPKTSSIKG